VPRATLAIGFAVVVVVAATISATAPALAQPVVVDTIPGEGWINDPNTTPGGTVRLVEGPATPPAGRGSLELGVGTTADRALVTNELGLVARPFDDLTASWSTYVLPGASPATTAPTLRLPSFQDATLPAEFTTVSIEPSRQGAVVAGDWQTWTVGPSTIVWQSNTTDGFCVQATLCTLAEFVAQYPNAAWGTVQLGVGTGVAGPVTGYADALTLSAGGETFEFDFEIPPDQSSTAEIGAVAATPLGGTAPITLTASTLAATPVTFVIMVGGESREVTLAAGETTTVQVDLPFGTTPISVEAQGVILDAVDATVIPPPTTTIATMAPAVPSPETEPPMPGAALPATGGRSSDLARTGIGLVVAGVIMLAARRAMRRWPARACGT
jgi:hypothetical protein